ncbi:hypothetical protein HALLA_01305 (plasmid) [Halostagnicola larsenii XH-48]|uniref:Uncharacterized protein n=1 Tax=Halostagnicola larsenii XH-48 TaxID=797299 RepID=W0JTQ5_9EURY|nr:hypothetical protein HALLA_01305 [Halostagnicola larsenii XH-48]
MLVRHLSNLSRWGLQNEQEPDQLSISGIHRTFSGSVLKRLRANTAQVSFVRAWQNSLKQIRTCRKRMGSQIRMLSSSLMILSKTMKRFTTGGTTLQNGGQSVETLQS